MVPMVGNAVAALTVSIEKGCKNCALSCSAPATTSYLKELNDTNLPALGIGPGPGTCWANELHWAIDAAHGYNNYLYYGYACYERLLLVHMPRAPSGQCPIREHITAMLERNLTVQRPIGYNRCSAIVDCS